MNRPTTAREALVLEALGDAARLLDQVEALVPALDGARQALLDAQDELGRRAEAFEGQIGALTNAARSRSVEFIARETAEVSRRTVEAQTRAMTQAARRIFDAEVGAVAKRLAVPLQQLVERTDRPWDRWLMHAATAATSSAMTWAVTAYLLHK